PPALCSPGTAPPERTKPAQVNHLPPIRFLFIRAAPTSTSGRAPTWVHSHAMVSDTRFSPTRPYRPAISPHFRAPPRLRVDNLDASREGREHVPALLVMARSTASTSHGRRTVVGSVGSLTAVVAIAWGCQSSEPSPSPPHAPRECRVTAPPAPR